MEAKEMEVTTGPDVYREHVENTLNNASDDRLTLENSLNRLGLSTILQKLDNSLEDVRRFKKTRDEHDQYLEHVDKTILIFSPHLDRARDKGGSDPEITASDLHATRAALRVLTGELLRKIEIDYKYCYFAQLDVRSLADRNETERLIKDVFDKMYKLSGVKRRIVEEIRSFLAESRQCVESYPRNAGSFMKHRSRAVHHLQRCIGEYNQLVTECDALERECKCETEESVLRVIQEVKERGLKESEVLTALEDVARSSLGGEFQIFSTREGMDEYCVLPFVYYVNVLLMCSAAIEEENNLPPRNLDPFANPYFEKAPNLFAKAYYLASYLYGNRQYTKTVEAIMRKKTGSDPSVVECEVREKFIETLSAIGVLLKNEFAIDGDKNDKEKPSERFERLKEALANSQENVHTCSKESEEISIECQQVAVKDEEVDSEAVKDEEVDSEAVKDEEVNSEALTSLEQNRKAIESFILSWEEYTTENGGASQNCNQKGRKKKPVTEEKFQKVFNQKLSELLLDIKQNMSKNQSRIFDISPREDVTICEKDDQEVWKECRQDMATNGENSRKENRIPESFKQNKSSIEEFSLKCEENTSVKKRVQEVKRKEKQVVEQEFQKLMDLKQNIPENENGILDKEQENSENYQTVEEETDSERIKKMKNTVAETKAISEKLSELLLNCVQNVTQQEGSSPNETLKSLNELRQILKDSEKNKREILQKHRPA